MEQSSLLPLSPLSWIAKCAAPLRRQVLDELRQSIIAGRLRPGARLIERELIAMMGVSRTVIREALRQLESEGLVAIIPNKGPIVRELTLAEARDLYSIRAVLEGLAVRLFVENASDSDVRHLDRELQATADAYAAGDPEQILAAKNRFYEVLSEGAGSETLSSMLSTLHVRIWRWRAVGLSHPQRSEKRWAESICGLRAMLDAIKNRDAARAESILREEVTKAAAEVMGLLDNVQRTL
jgi:GntR family transcriptional regulator, trigonelline degradation regulator